MKVKTTQRFFDRKEKQTREIGDEFEVTKTRLDEILSVGELVKVVEEKSSAKKKGD